MVVVDRTGADVAGAAMRIESCPAGCTRAELAERLAARAPSPAHLRVLVRPRAGCVHFVRDTCFVSAGAWGQCEHVPECRGASLTGGLCCR